ncbi:MAG: HAD hydrolase-like protein, partial [Asticcacaulis sp.]
LADSLGWVRENWNPAARRFGVQPVDPETFEQLRACHSLEIMQRLKVPHWKIPFLAAYLRHQFRRDCARIALFEGVAPMLRQLKAEGYQLAMVSSNTEANIRTVFGPELSGCVTYWACGASVFGKRPKFRKVLKALNLSPDQVVSIGDEVRDIEAAKAEGIRCAAVQWGYACPELLDAHKPDLSFSRLDDLRAWLCPTGAVVSDPSLVP